MRKSFILLLLLLFLFSISLVTSTGCNRLIKDDDVYAGDPDLEAETEADSDSTDGDEDVPVVVIDGDEEHQLVRIATYNVRRFFDTVCDSGSCGYNEYEPNVSQQQFDNKADSIESSIERIGADILLLQEIETETCLNALTQRLGDRYPVAYLGETGYNASVDVAVLAKGELLNVYTHREQPLVTDGTETLYFSREFPEIHLALYGKRVIVFPAHFKSKSSDDPQRRLAEARTAEQIVSDVAASHTSSLVVMGGDLNDTPGSDPLNALEAGGKLLRVASDLLTGEDATYYYDGPIALDHLYLATEAGGAYVSKSAYVVSDDYYSLGDSDHAALRADFLLP